MSSEPPMFRTFGHETVGVIHAEGTADEKRFSVEAHIQPDSGFVAVGTPIYEGDIIEINDPRGGTDRRLVKEVKIYDPKGSGFRNMRYTELKWGKAPQPRIAPVRRLTIDKFHPRVIDAAGKLFADGHFSRAVGEAFLSIEVRVRGLLGTDNSGTKLMDEAFGGKEPRLRVSVHEGRSGEDEQAGFHAIFRGAMLGVRNPGAHELAVEQDPQEALEYLALASLLHRRLDISMAEL